MRRAVWMFSGQGSQYYRMGLELYDEHIEFRRAMQLCESVACPLLGRSLLDIIFDPAPGRFDPFAQTELTNPALFSIQYSTAMLLRAQGLKASFLLGYSIGEFVALTVSGSISPQVGIRTVIEIAHCLRETASPGGMVAVLDSEALFHEQPSLFGECHLAAVNFDTNFVVAGSVAAIERVQSRLRSQGILHQRLSVEYAFHSPSMEPAKNRIERVLANVRYCPGDLPILSARGKWIDEVRIPAALWSAVREPVRLASTIKLLERDSDYVYVDLGPAGTLATCVKYNLGQDTRSKTVTFLTPFADGSTPLEELRETLRDIDNDRRGGNCQL